MNFFYLQQRYQFLDCGLIRYTEWLYDSPFRLVAKIHPLFPSSRHSFASLHIKALLFQLNIHRCFGLCSISHGDVTLFDRKKKHFLWKPSREITVTTVSGKKSSLKYNCILWMKACFQAMNCLLWETSSKQILSSDKSDLTQGANCYVSPASNAHTEEVEVKRPMSTCWRITQWKS